MLFQSLRPGLSVPLSQSRLLQIGVLLIASALILIVLTWAGQLGASHNVRVGLGVIALAGMVVFLQRFSENRILFGYLATGITTLTATAITLHVIYMLATGEYD